MTEPERVIPTGLLDFVENWPLAVLTASGVFFGFLFWIKQGLPLGAALFLDFIASVAIGMAARRAVLSYLGVEIAHECSNGSDGEDQRPRDMGIGQLSLQRWEARVDGIGHCGRDDNHEDQECPVGVSPRSEHVVTHDLDPTRCRPQDGPENEVGRHVGNHRPYDEGTPKGDGQFQHRKTEDSHKTRRNEAGAQNRAPRYGITCRIHGISDLRPGPSPFSSEAKP